MALPAGRSDVVVIGGGPAGATAALRAARLGLSVVLIERKTHPRFHIGESFLPRNLSLLRELGLLERALRLAHVPKFGAAFVMAHDESPVDFWFSVGPAGQEASAFSMARAPFDQMLADAAREAGVAVHEDTTVLSVDSLDASGAAIQTTRGLFRARLLIDASGEATVVGRHLRTRRMLPDVRRVAYYNHFRGVARRDGPVGGHPIIVMCDEGWFWMIPLDQELTSIGLVMEQSAARTTGVSAHRLLDWAIARCPFVQRRSAAAMAPTDNQVCADFSYTCAPYAGPGYLLVGDAATFVDPIFSTGVCLGMMSAVHAADGAASILTGRRAARAVQLAHHSYITNSSAVFFNLVRRYYHHAFREMLLSGSGPFNVHGAILAILAGHVFPRPALSLRWRLAMFEMMMKIQTRYPLAPTREGYSLLEASASAPRVSRRA